MAEDEITEKTYVINVHRRNVEEEVEYAEQVEINAERLSAILETSRQKNSMLLKKTEYIYHAVTENFIHCEIKSLTELKDLTSVELEIQSVLTENIRKGGETEASAKII